MAKKQDAKSAWNYIPFQGYAGPNLTPIPLASGLGAQLESSQEKDAKVEETKKHGSETEQTRPKTPEELAQQVITLRNSIPGWADQENALAVQQKALDEETRNRPTMQADYAGPLARGYDVMYGKHTADGYESPQAAMKDRIAQAAASAAKLQGMRTDVLKRYLDVLKPEQGVKETVNDGSAITDSSGTKDTTGTTLKATDPFKRIAAAQKPYDPNKDVQALGKDRAKYAPSMIQSLEQIDQALTGGIAAQTQNPETAKFPGSNLSAWTPSGMMDPKESAFWQAATDLALAKLQMRSGAQASEKEAKRYLAQLGLTVGSSQREKAQGLAKLVKETKQALGADEARFKKEAVDVYKAAPGSITSGDLDKYLSKGVLMVGPKGEQGLVDSDGVEDAKKNGWKVK